MKLSLTTTLSLVLPSLVGAFSIIPPSHVVPMATRTTQLGYTVFGGIGEEEDAEPNIFDQQKQQQQRKDKNGMALDFSQFSDGEDMIYDEVDKDIGVDAYSHGSAGGIMGGFALSGMCGDD